MRFGFKALLTMLMVLSFFGASGEVRAQAVGPVTTADDDASLRLLAERFYHSMESTDGTEYLSLWSTRSTDDESKRSKAALGYDKVRVESLVIREVRVSGDTADVEVKVHMSATSKRTGKPVAGYFGRDFFATLHCVREGGTWKVIEHASTGEELSKRIAAADTAEERMKLLADNQEIVSSVELINGKRRSLLAGSLQQRAREVEPYDAEKYLILYRLAVQLTAQVGDLGGQADLLSSLAVHYQNLGNQAQALEYYLRSLEVGEQAGPEENARLGYVRVNLGTLYSDQGDPAQALEWFLKVTNPRPWVAENIALAYLDLGDYPRALAQANNALSLCEKLAANQGHDNAVASSLSTIARVYQYKGDYTQAVEIYEKALRTAEASQQPARDLIVEILINLARIHLSQGNITQALEFVERTMTLVGNSTDSPSALQTVGRAFRLAGLNDRARQVLDKAIAGSEYRRSHAAGGETNRQRYFEGMVAPYHEMITLLISEKKSVEAFAYAERSKARALLDVLGAGRSDINKAMTAAERKRDRELRHEIYTRNRDLEVAKQNPKSDPALVKQLEASLEKARLEYEAFQTNLYGIHPELRAARGELRPVTLAETGELLPDSRTALLEYVVTDERTYLFVLTRTGSGSQPALKVYPIEIKQKDLGDRVARYREQLAKREQDFQKPARELFALLLGPAAEQLRDKSALVIVPDGVLWDLPFQALQSDQQRYLVENHTVFYAPSLTALRETMKRHGGGAAGRVDLLAMGNPVTGQKAVARAKNGLMDESLEPLPEAERQVVALARLYGPAKSKVYTGAAATEDRAKTDAPSFRVIQFATHGILNSRSPMYSHLVLSTTGKDEEEDGLLEAWEIMKLDLHADLVVLAACETARGRIGAGEGMIGMSWAFFVAGSPTTVASQWKVESASTTELMIEFHRNLRSRTEAGGARMSKARALQAASLKLLQSREYRHPFYWAGFVMIGDGY